METKRRCNSEFIKLLQSDSSNRYFVSIRHESLHQPFITGSKCNLKNPAVRIRVGYSASFKESGRIFRALR